jgi:hypothetical protein
MDKEQAGSSSPASGALPCTGPVARACRRATAHNYGSALVGEPAPGPAGIRVRLSSWPRQQEALSALRALGYQAAGDSRDGEHGAALVVTGWDTALLAARAARLEDAVRGFGRGAPEWAEAAITRFRVLHEEEGLDETSARDQAAADARSSAASLPGRPPLHVAAPVDDTDLLRAAGEARTLLNRVAAGEAAVTAMAAAAAQLAVTAIGLYLHYSGPGDDGESAAARAVREACADPAAGPARRTGTTPGLRHGAAPRR